MKPFTDQEREEWAAVHREAQALAEFFDRMLPGFAAAIADASEPSRPFRAGLAGLREARADLLDVAEALSPHELRALDQHLRERIGVPLDVLDGKRLARIATLRARGKLTTDEQFRVVYGRHEQIWDGPAHAEEAAELRALMASYEETVERRLRGRRPKENEPNRTP